MIDSTIRMLAAIMFTDMVGYTALMQKDEARAKLMRDRHRKVLEEKVASHQGRILQYYGDGTLSIFGSAIQAVLCAIDIQYEFNREPKIPLRIGIHTGDVVYEDEGVYGDGVNVASRIESLSVPGAVLVSDKIYDEVQNHPDIKTTFIGSFELKNVRKPIEMYSISNDGLRIPTREEITTKVGTSFKSIAVLPFVNMSADQDNEYFSDGITEELLNALSKVEGLNVTSRTSAFAFKGKELDIREIGAMLDVNTVLEGSVRKAGNRVRITAQLINTSDGYHIWSETFDRNLEDIFEVQDEISRNIANKLREKLTRNEIKEPLVKSYKCNPHAYSLYLKGVCYWNKWNPADIKKAMEFFEEVISTQPEFPPAYARMAGCYIYLGATGYMSSKTAYPKAKELALKSLELDKNIAESHLALGLVQLFYEWNWKEAEKSLLLAIELNPGSAETHMNYSMYLSVMGRYEKAFQEVEKAYSLDPLSVVMNNAYGAALSLVKRYDDAIEQLEKTLEMDPEFRSALYELGWVYYDMGNIDEAIEVFADAQKGTGHELKGVTQLGYVCAAAGNKEQALECLRKLEERKKLEPEVSLNIDFAIIYAGLNDLDKTFHYLEKAFEEKSGGLIFIRSHRWKNIQKDERYHDLIKRMGLAE